MGLEREEGHIHARLAGFSRFADEGPGLSELDAYKVCVQGLFLKCMSSCKVNHIIYILICMGHGINAR